MTLSDTQEQILDATMTCIVRDGIERTSMRNVARRADVSLGLLSYHFDDKRSLIEAAFQLATARLFDATVDALDGVDDAEERVRAFIRGAFRRDFLDAEYLALRIALWAISRTDEGIAEIERGMHERYSSTLTTLVREARPALSERDAARRATDVIVTQNGLWLNWARHHDQCDLDRGLARCDAIALDPT